MTGLGPLDLNGLLVSHLRGFARVPARAVSRAECCFLKWDRSNDRAVDLNPSNDVSTTVHSNPRLSERNICCISLLIMVITIFQE